MENKNSRRDFLRNAAIGGAVVTAAVITSGAVTAAGNPLVFSKDNEGSYAGKAGSHAPVITVKGSVVTVTTNHGMSEAHHIALHVLQGAAKYFGSYEFKVTDFGDGKIAVSTFDIGEYKGPLKAISVCNLHDTWVSEGSV